MPLLRTNCIEIDLRGLARKHCNKSLHLGTKIFPYFVVKQDFVSVKGRVNVHLRVSEYNMLPSFLNKGLEINETFSLF